MIPRNYIHELSILLTLAIIGALSVAFYHYNQTVVALGTGLFTGAVVSAASLTSNACRQRRADLEQMATSGVRLLTILKWISHGMIGQRSLSVIDDMILELKEIPRVYGRLWFIKEDDWNNAYALYNILMTFDNVELNLIQYRLTTDNEGVDVEGMKTFFGKLFQDNPDIIKDLDDLTDWAIGFCSKSHF